MNSTQDGPPRVDGLDPGSPPGIVRGVGWPQEPGACGPAARLSPLVTHSNRCALRNTSWAQEKVNTNHRLNTRASACRVRRDTAMGGGFRSFSKTYNVLGGTTQTTGLSPLCSAITPRTRFPSLFLVGRIVIVLGTGAAGTRPGKIPSRSTCTGKAVGASRFGCSEGSRAQPRRSCLALRCKRPSVPHRETER